MAWLNHLDVTTEAIVLNRIDRLEDGNFGDCKAVGGGVLELRIDFGPGYRVYFGQLDREVHLIRGGQKRNQQSDIAAAQKFWRDHD